MSRDEPAEHPKMNITLYGVTATELEDADRIHDMLMETARLAELRLKEINEQRRAS